MGIDNISIVFDNPSLVYYPGQWISGRVILILNSKTTIRVIEVKISGKGKVSWEENETYRDSDNEVHTRCVIREGKEKYVTNKYNLMGGSGEFEMPLGQHTYPFSAILPGNIPSSFKGKHGEIEYKVKVKLDIPWARDKENKAKFQVVNPFDLNSDPSLKEPFRQEIDKTFCCWCCASGPLSLGVYVPFTGFIPSQSIPITVQINNKSSVKMESISCKLTEKIEWIARNDKKTSDREISKMVLDGVNKNDSKTNSVNFYIAEEPFPYLANCGIIKKSYFLMIEAVSSGVHKNLCLKVPVKMGSVPLNGGEMNQPSFTAICPPHPGFQLGLGSAQEYPPQQPGYMPTNTQSPYPEIEFSATAPPM